MVAVVNLLTDALISEPVIFPPTYKSLAKFEVPSISKLPVADKLPLALTLDDAVTAPTKLTIVDVIVVFVPSTVSVPSMSVLSKLLVPSTSKSALKSTLPSALKVPVVDILPLALIAPLAVILPVIFKSSVNEIESVEPPDDWNVSAITIPLALMFPLAVIWVIWMFCAPKSVLILLPLILVAALICSFVIELLLIYCDWPANTP